MPALKKVKLPNNTTVDINDARVVSDGIVYIGDEAGSATYEADGTVVDISDFARKDWVENKGYLTSHQSIKTINNQSIVGTGNITISGGSGGEANVIEAITFNGSEVPVTDKTAAITASIPAEVTESTVSGWGFTKNTGTYSKPSGGIPKTDLASAVQTSLGKADTALQSYTETDPTVPSWAKQPAKPTYTAAEVGALPDTTSIPTKTSDLTNDSGFITGYTETDPTVPAWAKAATKPTYTASEVGALPSSTSIPSALSDLSADSTHRTVTDTEKSTWNNKQNAITISSSEPTNSQGSNGDIWIVI